MFLAIPSVSSENEFLGSVSLMIQFKLFNLNTGKEISFPEKHSDFPPDLLGHDFYMNSFVKCSFDEESPNCIKMEERDQEALKILGYKIEFEVVDYYKEVGFDIDCCYVESEAISEEEFFLILKKYKDNFNNSDNKSTQSVAYCIVDHN